ncbi:MAG: hypothetical protein KDK34_19235, partial [Leptospiraceae bacterium]|nr:hypothetical protein [Leptospiraceae bacterium]
PFTFRFDRAVFTDSKLAAEAAVRIIKHVREINPRICVKIGLHAGPCLAVNSNDKLDYFGTTVNRAARIQGQSLGNDIVMSIDFEHSHGLRIPDQFTRMPFQSTLKGLKGTADLVRWSYVQGNKRI